VGGGLAGWFHETRRAYFGNAAAQRDFRVQLRGNRSVLLFGVYLTILIWVAYLRYSSIQTSSTISVVYAQRQLNDFYQLVVNMLAGMVVVVTPALAATAVVTERQRRSLDLVFSAPVPPRYYLVGKIIAVYRYIWMLLILSLPVTATCVVLGGASWTDVLAVYALLSVHGLLFAAFGLMMSTVCDKPLNAIIYTYLSVGLFLAVSGSGGAAAMGLRSFLGGGGGEQSFLVSLNPFLIVYTVGTYSTIAGVPVPNLLLGSAICLWVVRLCLLGAGSLLSEGRETAKLRINWAVTASAVSFITTYLFAASGAYQTMTRPPTPTATAAPATAPSINPFAQVDPRAVVLGMILFWILSPVIFTIAKLSAYGDDGYLRQRDNGWFRIPHTLDGTPAGGLPYLLLLVALTTVSLLVGIAAGGGPLPGWTFAYYILYTVSFWVFFWSVTRVPSSLGSAMRTATTTCLIVFLAFVVLPAPFLSSMASNLFMEPGWSVWDLYVLRPVLPAGEYQANAPLVWSLVLLAIAAVLHLKAELNRRRRLAGQSTPPLIHA
jgi:ABC-type transport system involved in multi-copper enzyme maturation permease subunit